MGMVKEFKEFALKGNVVDMAVGVIIGAAFGKIVTSIVEDMFMPLIGAMTKGVDFAKYAYEVKNPMNSDEVLATVAYGKTIAVTVTFLLTAFCLFLVIKAMNSARRKEAPVSAGPAPLTKDQSLLVEIRDALKQR